MLYMVVEHFRNREPVPVEVFSLERVETTGMPSDSHMRASG